MSNKYHQFFMESDEGQEYIKALEKLIDQKHQEAERDPVLSRDHTQRAKGIREALNQAYSMSTEAKKPE